jgi:choice-of-anchor C domain-containing protein
MDRLKRTWIALVATALALPAVALAAGGNLAKNGSFEKPVVPGGFQTFNAPSSIGPWKVVADSVDVVHTSWVAAKNKQSLDLSGSAGALGAIEQQLSTAPGAKYTLKFFLAGNTYCGPSVKQMRVRWDGTEVDTLEFDITGKTQTKMGWKAHSYSLVAADASTTLRFESLTNSGCGAALDAVSVKPAA